MPLYDVLIPFHEKDLPILPYCISSIKQNAVGANQIFIVSEKKPDIDEDFIWIPESQLPITKDDVATYIHSEFRLGWYYQQLVKLYSFKYLPTKMDHLLLLDSDVILKKKISFFSEKGEILLAYSEENEKTYFHHMSRLVKGLTRHSEDKSGICHHMMIKKEHIESLIQKIEEEHNEPAWKAILLLVDPEYHELSGMSEYEIIFNYCLTYYPADYKIRPLLTENISNFGELNQSKADLVAIHAWARTL